MRNSYFSKSFLFILFCFSFSILGQEKNKTVTTPTPEIQQRGEENEVLKIDTDLIQTGVTVLDKTGQFVERLNKDDFEVKVDGKRISPAFFEARIGNREIKKSDVSKIGNSNSNKEPDRTIVFVVDDLHLNQEGHVRVKNLLMRFIENELKNNDNVAIVSTTGKIGFLQQFTNDKVVLLEAIERLNYNRSFSAADRMNPPMSEYEALLIERLDPSTTTYFARKLMSEIPGLSEESAKDHVRSRARSIIFETKTISQQTLSVLEQTIRKSAQMPARKMIMFLSDGFLVDQQNSDVTFRLQRITDAASRANAVIYSFDVTGFEFDNSSDNSGNFRVKAGERFEVQDALSYVAEATGGRFVNNRNDIGIQVEKAIVEASGYYLLAWEPETEVSAQDKLKKIEISIVGRPELQVRMQSGFFSQNISIEKTRTEQKSQVAEIISETQLVALAQSQIIKKDLPTAMVLNYLEMPKDGASLSVALQIKNQKLEFSFEKETTFAKVDFLGLIYNSEGKLISNFRDRMTLSYKPTTNKNGEQPDMVYNFQTILKPGLYQVRIASKDLKSGNVGNAVQWIKIPDVSTKKLVLSSLLLGERFSDIGKAPPISNVIDSNPTTAGMSVDRIFSRSSNLRYLIFVYNAVEGNRSDVTIQTKLYQKGKTLMKTSPRPISNNSQEDSGELFYAAEIPLSNLIIDSYEIEIIVEDHVKKQVISRKVPFEVR